MSSTSTFTKKVLIASVVFLLVAGIMYMLANFFSFFLLVFAGLLLAVLFSAIANFLVRVFKIKRSIGLFLAVILFLGVTIGSWWLMAPTINEQFLELKDALPQAVRKLKMSLMERSLGRKLVEQLEQNGSDYLPNGKSLLSRATHFLSSTLDIIADCLIILITGIFFAVNPMVYILNVVNLVPPRLRSRFFEVLDECYRTLKLWLLAKFFSMLIIGVLTGIGLALLGVPMAMVLALIAFFYNIHSYYRTIFIGCAGSFNCVYGRFGYGILRYPAVFRNSDDRNLSYHTNYLSENSKYSAGDNAVLFGTFRNF